MAALSDFLFAPTDKTPRSRQIFWFVLSLTVAVILAIPALQEAFSSKYVVQDDARQHVFWMSRFIDPALFPNDLIADYFQSVAPQGYAAFYYLFAKLGIDPLFLHKCLPPLLALVATAYAFGATLAILPLPFAGFLTSLLLNHSLWMRDDIVSATPVAFVYPIFFAFLYYLLRRELLPCLVTIALQGLFYPQLVFVIAGVLLLQLVQWQEGRLHVASNWREARFSLAGLGMAVLIMLPYALRDSVYGPVLAGVEARTLPALMPDHWSEFFSNNFFEFWFCGKRSGMLPSEWCWAGYDFLPIPDQANSNLLRMLRLPHVLFALALPLLVLLPARFPLVRLIQPNRLLVLPQVLLVSLSFFFIAHSLIFKLHLPNRYTEHSLRIITALAAGIALTVILEALLRFRPNLVKSSVAAVLAIVILLYPIFLRIDDASFPIVSYVVEEQPALYDFLAEQPKDSVVASIAPSVNKIPSFARRSILVGGEGYVLPYHIGYYQQLSQRITDLIQAQYNPDLEQVKQFIQNYDVDFWLLEDLSFRPRYFQTNPIFAEFPVVLKQVRPQLRNGVRPALRDVAESCSVFQDEQFTLVNAACVLAQDGLNRNLTQNLNQKGS